MAFVRKRRSAAGHLSTALVEAYRDEEGRPRQRVLVNLHGCETPLEALAKLAVQRKRLRVERQEIDAFLTETADAPALSVEVALNPEKFNLSATGYAELNGFLRKRKKAAARLDRITALQGVIQRDGVVIHQHVDASKKKVQRAIKAYQEQLTAAENMVAGSDFSITMAKIRHTEAKRKFARLSLPGEAPEPYDADIVQMMINMGADE